MLPPLRCSGPAQGSAAAHHTSLFSYPRLFAFHPFFSPFLILLPPPFLPCWAIMESGRDCCRQPRAREGRRALCNVVYDFSEEKHRLHLAQRNRLCLRAPVSLDCRQAECLNVLEGQGGQEVCLNSSPGTCVCVCVGEEICCAQLGRSHWSGTR